MKEHEAVIRKAGSQDVEDILEVQRAAFMRYTEFLEPEQLPPINETIEQASNDIDRKECLVAEHDRKVCGSIRYLIKGGVCMIERLSVHPDVQGKGIGRALVGEVEQDVKGDAHKIYLETGLLAHNLLIFYTRLGFSGEAVLRNHVGRHDWIVFSKFI